MKRIKKIFRILILTITLLIIGFTIFSASVNKNYGNGVFGRKFFIVLSDSMKPEFSGGDVVITKAVESNTLVVGDIITFYKTDGTVVTHQINEIKEVNNEIVYYTKGINVDVVDENYIQANKIIGKYTFSIPKVGNVIMFMKSKVGFFTTIFIPLLLIVILYLIDFIKIFKQYKKSKVEVIETEKLEYQAMKKELQALKNQLNLTSDNNEV